MKALLISESYGIKNRGGDTGKTLGKNLVLGLVISMRTASWTSWLPTTRSAISFCLRAIPVDRALERGAYDRRGESSAAMGIDIDRDLASQELVVMGNFFREMTSLYVNAEGATSFIDESVAEGIGPRTNARTTFGALFVDYDNDGYRDIFEVNGAIQALPPSVLGTEQPGDIFWHCGGRCNTTYVYLGKTLSGDFSNPIVGRDWPQPIWTVMAT